MSGPVSHYMKSPRRFLENFKLPPVGPKKYKHSDYTVLASDFMVRSVMLKTVEKGSYVTRGEGKNYCVTREHYSKPGKPYVNSMRETK